MSKLMLAVWKNENKRQFWSSQDTCTSMWLSLRLVEQTRLEDGSRKVEMDSYGPDGVAARDVGIYVWSSTGGGCHVELKAHEVYSATACELTRLAKWLTTYCKKIEKADIPQNFGVKETIILTLRAMGIKEAINIDTDWRSNDHKVISVEDALALPNYGGPLVEMEAMRQTAYGVAA